VEQNRVPSALSYFVFRKRDPCVALRWSDLTAGNIDRLGDVSRDRDEAGDVS
jgi:hypothetical protein